MRQIGSKSLSGSYGTFCTLGLIEIGPLDRVLKLQIPRANRVHHQIKGLVGAIGHG